MSQPDPVPYLVRHFARVWYDAYAALFAAAFLQQEVTLPEGYQLPPDAWDTVYQVGKVGQEFQNLIQDMEKAKNNDKGGSV